LRAALGARVLPLLEAYGDFVTFCAPDICILEARKYIPEISARKKQAPSIGFALLDQVLGIVERIDSISYSTYRETAFRRISARDPNDWPILATALLLDCPLWTEDQDFFGTGIATWTTNNFEIYLSQP